MQFSLDGALCVTASAAVRSWQTRQPTGVPPMARGVWMAWLKPTSDARLPVTGTDRSRFGGLKGAGAGAGATVGPGTTGVGAGTGVGATDGGAGTGVGAGT